MYDYELKPQAVSRTLLNIFLQKISGQIYDHTKASVFISQAGIATICKDYFRFLNDCDGAITHTNNLVEAGAIQDVKKWLGEKNCLTMGPLSPPTSDVELKKWSAKERSNSFNRLYSPLAVRGVTQSDPTALSSRCSSTPSLRRSWARRSRWS